MDWKQYLENVISSFARDLEELAHHTPRMVFSIIVSLDDRRKIRQAQTFVTAFKELYQDHFDTYMALEQETGQSIQDAETKKEVTVIFARHKNAIVGALKILNVKAEVALDQFESEHIELPETLKSQLQKLKVMTLEKLKECWLSGTSPL